MTSPRRIVSSLYPTRFLGPAIAALQRQWHTAALADEPTALCGVVVGTRLGPLQDGELTLDVDGEQWTVKVGHPWRSEQVGLHAHLMAPGRTLQVVGRCHTSCHTSAQQHRLHADQVTVEGRTFDLPFDVKARGHA